MPYPSVLLHDHLDGGMRPKAVLDLAAEFGYANPIGVLYRAGFNVTLSTDNRLMSATSMSDEFDFVTKYHRFEPDDLARTTWRSLDAAFCPWEVKAELWEHSIAPLYAASGVDIEMTWR